MKEPMGGYSGFKPMDSPKISHGPEGTIGGNIGAWGSSIVFHKGSP